MCNPAQTTCLWCKNCKKWRSVKEICTKTKCMEAPTSWSSWKVLWNHYRWNRKHLRWASRQFPDEVETRFTLWYREDMWVDRERHMEKTNVVVEWKVSKDKSEKSRLWKLCKVGGNKDKYLDAKRKAQHAAYTAKRNTEKEKFASVKVDKENIFHATKQMRTENLRETHTR